MIITYDFELIALAAELRRDAPHLSLDEATACAVALLDEIAEYAVCWDADAALPISLIETPAA